jgi:hypothetical protein
MSHLITLGVLVRTVSEDSSQIGLEHLRPSGGRIYVSAARRETLHEESIHRKSIEFDRISLDITNEWRNPPTARLLIIAGTSEVRLIGTKAVFKIDTEFAKIRIWNCSGYSAPSAQSGRSYTWVIKGESVRVLERAIAKIKLTNSKYMPGTSGLALDELSIQCHQ